MFAPTDPDADQPDAISAVKALQKANAQGQKIYTITQANQAEILPQLHLGADVINDITAALRVGKEVTTHTDLVSIPGGWTGAGYIILDPITGAGAYLISGGLNGGQLILDKLKEFFWLALEKAKNLGAKIFLKIKKTWDTIQKIISILSVCPPVKAAIAYLSLFLFTAGLTLAFGAVFTATGGLTGFVLGAFYSLFVVAPLDGFLASGWLRSCE